jgi:hypothetical protein
MLADPFLGRFVTLNISLLRHRIGPQFDQLLRELDISPGHVEKLETGFRWQKVDRHTLFALLALAKANDVWPLFDVCESPLWETFRGDTGFMVVGCDLSGSQLKEDMRVAESLIHSGLGLRVKTVDDNVLAPDVTRWMMQENVMFVGAPKVNRAAELALAALWKGSTPPIRFLWPDFPRESALVGSTVSRNRGLFVEDLGILEEKSPERRLGVLVVCREPLGATGVTTVILAGCSREATMAMERDLRNSEFYYRYPYGSADVPKGTPMTFVFQSNDRQHRWHLVGKRKSAKKTGRRAGTTKRRQFRP